MSYEEQKITDENLLEESASLTYMNPPPELLSSNMQDGTKNSSTHRVSHVENPDHDFNDRESVTSPNSNVNPEMMYD